MSILGKVTNVYINGNAFVGNLQWGVNAIAVSSGIVDATNNWWGEPSGPYHPVLNPSGIGDSVSDKVMFKPFLIGPGLPTQAKFEMSSLPPINSIIIGSAVTFNLRIKNKQH